MKYIQGFADVIADLFYIVHINIFDLLQLLNS